MSNGDGHYQWLPNPKQLTLIETVTDELKFVAGRGTKSTILSRMKTLREMFKTDTTMSDVSTGSLLRASLYYSVDDVTETTFNGREVGADCIRKALKINLDLTNIRYTASARRFNTIDELGEYLSEVTWRKEGYERQFVRILAQHLVWRYYSKQEVTTALPPLELNPA
jgi:transcriptional regulator NrdR family protein